MVNPRIYELVHIMCDYAIHKFIHELFFFFKVIPRILLLHLKLFSPKKICNQNFVAEYQTNDVLISFSYDTGLDLKKIRRNDIF